MPKKIKKPPIKGIAQVSEDKLTVIKVIRYQVFGGLN